MELRVRRAAVLYTGLYLVAIVAANLTTAHFGVSASYFNAFAFIGLDLVAKDGLQDAWQGRHLVVKMALLVATGSLVSYLLNRNAGTIAVASFVAFAAALSVDAVVYQFLRKKSWLIRSNGSNIPGAAVDSIVFPTIAFGGFAWGVTLLQFACKVAGGVVWSFVIGAVRHDSRSG